MIINISPEITSAIPEFDIIAMAMDISIEDSNRISELISFYEKKIYEEYSLEDVLNIPLIKEARDAYKKFGKDPSRYRLACESLIRRLVKGNQLYKINNVVDAGNILSIITKRAVAVLDFDEIKGDILVRLGREDDEYYGIGRGILNITNIPLYEDNIGPFGSTTSDTERTMVTEKTKKILLMIICFSNSYQDENRAIAIDLYKKYGNAMNIEDIKIIRK
ncbi:MAG: phenylalanine--tRNA ligase beta subunit-related protein [Bacilli bacterium]|nr:phenylalanine--tRNA ligase beta subunit-related protein [Bacilli bacterium]